MAARVAQLARRPGVLLVAGALVLQVLAVNSRLYGWGDDAHYMIVADAVSSGDGLRDILFPGEPRFAYPIPLFPLVLSPFVAVFGFDLLPPKLLVLATGVAAVYATYRLFRTRVEEWLAVAIAATVAVSPQFVSFTHQVMTEVPYLLLSLLGLLGVERYAAASAPWRSRALALAAVPLVAALLLRSIGIALIAAAIAWLVLDGPGDRRTRLLKAGAIGGLCLAAWFAVNFSTLGRIPYASELRGGATAQQGTDEARLDERIRSNVEGYVDAIPEVISYRLFIRPSDVGAALLLLVAAVGLVHALRRRRGVVEYYVLAYLAVLLAYPPSNSGNLRRYLIPLIPFLVYHFALGVRLAVDAVAARRPRPLPGGAHAVALTVAVLALFGAVNLFETARASVLDRRPEMFDFRPYTDFEGGWALARWTRAHTPARSLVSTQDPYGFYFHARRQVTWHPYVPPGGRDPGGAVARQLAAEDVTHVAVDTAQQADVAALLERHPDDFVRVHARAGHALYRVRAAGGPSAAR